MLDPGAGVGSSGGSLRTPDSLRSPRQIEIVLYENDATLLPLLEENMRRCREALKSAGHELRYTIQEEDFILGTRGRRPQRMLFDDDECSRI